MNKIIRKKFTQEAIVKDDTHRFTVEPYELCKVDLQSQVGIGNNSLKFSCVLYDEETNQVYGYILTKEIDFNLWDLISDDPDFKMQFSKSKGLQVTEIVIDERLEDKQILYLINMVHNGYCNGNFELTNRYIWYYLYGRVSVIQTFQYEVFKRLGFNSLSKDLYLHVKYAEKV